MDSPSLHPSGFMPILDLQIKTENNQIIYKFYKKKVSNNLVILNKSKIPAKVKRITCIQEVIRRLRNTKRELSWSIKREILTEFSWSLHQSGYPEQFRLEVISSGINAYEMQCARADAGVVPLHRDRHWDTEGRRKRKLMSKTSWYRPRDAVGFFPATPGQELAKIIQEIVDEEGERLDLSVKINETGGQSLRSQLVRTDLSGCLMSDCELCESGAGGGSHTRRGCVYSGTCKVCEEEGTSAKYFGESGRNGYHRLKEHTRDIKANNLKNAFSKHLQLKHPDKLREPSVFSYKVEGTFRSCLDRQVQEGVRITLDDSDETLNSKSEYHQPGVTRVVTTREVAERNTGR